MGRPVQAGRVDPFKQEGSIGLRRTFLFGQIRAIFTRKKAGCFEQKRSFCQAVWGVKTRVWGDKKTIGQLTA